MSEPAEATTHNTHQTGRSWLKATLIALVFLLALVTGLYLSIVPLLNNWLPPVLDQFVAPGSHLKIRSLTRQQFAVDELDVQPSPGLLIQIRNAELNYHGTALLQGEADSLTIETLRIVASENDTDDNTDSAGSQRSAPDASGSPVEIPQLAALMQLPVKDIRVQSLEIELPEMSAHLNAVLQPEHWSLTGDARLPELQQNVEVNLQLQQTDEHLVLLAALSNQQTTELLAQLSAEIHQVENNSRADLIFQADLAELQTALPTLSDIPISGKQLALSGSVASPDNAHWPADLTANISASLDTDSSTVSDNLSVAGSELTLSVSKDSPEADWNLILANEPISARLITLTDGVSDQWRIGMPAQSLHFQCSAEMTRCGFDKQTDARTGNQVSLSLAGPTELDLTIKPSGQWQANGESQLALSVASNYQQSSQQAEKQGVPAFQLSAQGVLRAALTPEQNWQVTSDEGIAITLRPEEYEGWKVSSVSATVLKDLSVTGNLQNLQRANASDLNLKISPFSARNSANNAHLRFAPTLLTCTPGELDITDITNALLSDCQLSMRLNDSDWDLWPVPDVSLTGPVRLTMDELRQRVTASLDIAAANGEIRLRTRTEHNLLTGEGAMQWHLTEARLDWMALGLTKMANLTSVQLLNGELSGQGWIDWQQSNDGIQIKPDMMLRADGVGLIYDNSMTFEGWNAMLALRRPQSGDYQLDAQVSGSKLDTGVPLTNLLARTQTRFPEDLSHFEIDVHEIHTNLLGGRIYAPEINYDSRKEVNSFGVRLDHLQLSQIAAIEKEAGIRATGLLDGMLPVVLTKAGPMVPGGNLFARDPGGVIQYQDDSADALAQADQSVGMAMQLLENFQYDELQSGIRYQPDGQLNLSLKFQGKNPDFFDGQATNLNVNLDYNLLDLLESLRIANDVIEKVEQKYK